MRRRDILILLGVVLIAPLGAPSQNRSGKPWRIGFVGPPPVRGMQELGYKKGQDFVIVDVVYDANKPDEAAREMVQHLVALRLEIPRALLATAEEVIE